MIICPNCLHQNENGAEVCEVCHTSLPSASSCPNCGESIQAGGQFCGHCGFHLTTPHSELDEIIALTGNKPDPGPPAGEHLPIFPDSQPPDPLMIPDWLDPPPEPPIPSPVAPATENPPAEPSAEEPAPLPAPTSTERAGSTGTYLQQQTMQLVHMQTNTVIDFPSHLELIHIGKPNDRVPPDIDVSSFPNAEVVSRVHADIRVEGGHFFIEDTGSVNGTYINSIPLVPGNQHRLRIGDRIALGKGNLVTFLFQLN